MAGRPSPSTELPQVSRNSDHAVELNESTLTEIVRRVYDSVQSISEERPNPVTRSTNASVEEEMAQRFCLPRRRQEQTPQLPRVNNRSFTYTRPGYNPQINYGHGVVTRGKGRGKAKSTATKAKEAASIINKKELILLPYPTYSQVPRYEHKRKLQELGLIVDGFPLEKSWNENELRLKIGGAFVTKLEDEEGEFVNFEYVESIGQNICPLNLYGNKEPSGENIYSMCKQGPIYVRACKMLKVWGVDEILDSDETCETEMEEATTSSISASHNQFAGTKRSRQTTINVTNKPNKRAHLNEESLTSGRQSCENVVGDEANIDHDDTLNGTTTSLMVPSVSLADYTPRQLPESVQVSDKIACGLDDMYATLLFDEVNSDVLDSDLSDEIVETDVDDTINDSNEESITLQEILTNLAKSTSYDQVSIFNISRNHIWDGTKRALNRKSFSPEKKLSVKFMDDIGQSEGAVDLGGPAREFFTLITEWLVNSPLFFGETTAKFLSLNAICLDEREYFMAGEIFAMSLVHGGPGANCLSSTCYDALVNETGTLNLISALDDVTDFELRTSLGKLLQAPGVDDARQIIDDEKLDTVFDMAGTFQVIRSKADVDKIVQRTINWYVLGRCQPAYSSFKEGLKALGVLEAMSKYPKLFREAFCYKSQPLTVSMVQSIFTVACSEEGSNRRNAESLILSHWNDFLQDAEEDPTQISLLEILFFASGCKILPPQELVGQIHFLHEAEKGGKLSKFPKANTCACILKLPVVHVDYKSFENAMVFGIKNARGFGCA